MTDFNHTGRGATLGGITGPVGYPLGTVRVRPGEVAELEVDVADVWPGRLEIVAVHATQPLGDALVELEPVGSHAHLPYPFGADIAISRTLTRLTDGSGRALFERVPPGRWRMRVRDGEWLWASSAGECEIQSGERVERHLAIQLVEADVNIVDPETLSPLRHVDVQLEMAPGVRVTRSTDATGKLRLRLGPGTYPLSRIGASAESTALLQWNVDGPVNATLPLPR